MPKNDGDIIKGLGFVTLYSAYMEEMIDDFLFLVNHIEEYSRSQQHWPISRKIIKAKSILVNGYLGEQDALISILEKASSLFEKRNEIVHGRIYAKYRNKDILKSGRPNVPDRIVAPKELYDLANELFTLRGDMYSNVIKIRSLPTLHETP